MVNHVDLMMVLFRYFFLSHQSEVKYTHSQFDELLFHTCKDQNASQFQRTDPGEFSSNAGAGILKIPIV